MPDPSLTNIGGAAVYIDPKDNYRGYVVGIASSYVDCGRKLESSTIPSIFAAIPGKVADWILELIGDFGCDDSAGQSEAWT